MGQLNELKIKSAKPRDKEYLLADGEGLYLRVRSSSRSAKVWVYRYKGAGKEAKLTLGPYPALPLAAARKKARAEAEKRATGVNPRLARREEAERSRVARRGHHLGRLAGVAASDSSQSRKAPTLR